MILSNFIKYSWLSIVIILILLWKLRLWASCTQAKIQAFRLCYCLLLSLLEFLIFMKLMLSLVFFGSLTHIAELISPLIDQTEHVKKAEEPSKHLPQGEKYVIRGLVSKFSGIKISTVGLTSLRIPWATTRQIIWKLILENESYGHHIWRELRSHGTEERRS